MSRDHYACTFGALPDRTPRTNHRRFSCSDPAIDSLRNGTLESPDSTGNEALPTSGGASEPLLGLLHAATRTSEFRRAKRTVEAWGGRIHLVYMPTLRRYRSWLGEPILGRQEILGAAAELGIPVIDLEPSFRATGEPQPLWLPGGHLNAAGYSLAAERITAEASD